MSERDQRQSEEVSALLAEIRQMRTDVAHLRVELDHARSELAASARFHAERLLQDQSAISPTEPPAPSAPAGIRRPVAWVRSMSARGEWAPAHTVRWDIIALSILTVVAIATRFAYLTSSPAGMQGDEAAVGLEAQRILDDGWIGFYSPAAAGTPTGYYLLAAPFVAIEGNTVLAVRLLSASLGVLTILGAYILLRRNLGFWSAVVGAGILAIFGWHLIFSRISFLTISWPFFAIFGLVLLFEGVRSRRWEWWFGAGAVLALGLYTYNGHSLFLLLLGAFTAWTLFGWRALVCLGGLAAFYMAPGLPTAAAALGGIVVLAFARQVRVRANIAQAMGFAAGLALAALPMARWVLSNEETYFGRGRRLSVFRSSEWTSLQSTADQVRFLGERYIEFWNMMTFAPRPDGVDTSGNVPILPVTMLVLVGVGIVAALLLRNTPLIRLGIATVALMPVASIAFTDFAIRRTLIMAPFLAMFCAIALVELTRWTWRRGFVIRTGSLIGSAILLGVITWQNLDGYFVGTNHSTQARWVLGTELVETIDYMNTLDDGTYIYFASNRWPISMEVIRFLGPDLVGETRFAPYGADSTAIDRGLGTPVWILMGPNQARLAEIEALYPGGEIVTPETDGPDQPAYIAYFPPGE